MSDAPPRLRVHYLWERPLHRALPWAVRPSVIRLVTLPRVRVMYWLIGAAALAATQWMGVGPGGRFWLLAGVLIGLASVLRWRFGAFCRSRWLRLAAIAYRADAPHRWPHRVWEGGLHWGFDGRAQVEGTLVHLPPGHVIVVNARRAAPRPKPVNIPFEPAHLFRDGELLLGLQAGTLAAQAGAGPSGPDEASPAGLWRPGLADSVPRALWWSSIALVLGIPVGDLVLKLVPLHVARVFGFVVALVMARVAVAVWNRPREHWWLAPGTLIYRRASAGRARPRAGWFRAEDAALVLDCSRHVAWFRAGDQVCRFPYDADADWAILAGWLSTARRPTPTEIMSFLGPDVVVHADQTPTATQEETPQ